MHRGQLLYIYCVPNTTLILRKVFIRMKAGMDYDRIHSFFSSLDKPIYFALLTMHNYTASYILLFVVSCCLWPYRNKPATRFCFEYGRIPLLTFPYAHMWMNIISLCAGWVQMSCSCLPNCRSSVSSSRWRECCAVTRWLRALNSVASARFTGGVPRSVPSARHRPGPAYSHL